MNEYMRDEAIDRLTELRTKLQGLVSDVSSFEDEMHPESMQLHLNMNFKLFGPNGELKEERNIHNLICTAGKNKLLDVAGTAKYLKDYTYICIGTGTTAANAADTALQTESTRSAGTLSNPTAATWQNQVTFGAGTGTGAVTESGLDYQGTASGAILAHQVFSAINKGASDSLQVTWQIT